MPNRVYALLVGINEYPPEVRNLAGCLNDVDRFHEYLEQHVDRAALAVEALKNDAATRLNIIDRFRAHLGQARAGDVALFHFSGHGARWASNAAFREFYPDGKDEGLVCFDSRRPGGYDLADKELAALIAEVAANQAHVAVLLDCCHSGSGTRGVDAFSGFIPRLTDDVETERPLESYLHGHYARLRAAKQPLFIPRARHILLAACERGQLAQEAAGRGLFTSTLVDVLEKSGGDVSYADLFVRCRAAVKSRAFDQNPQFEAFGGFDGYTGFLARSLTRPSRGRYLTYCDEGVWTAECGTLSGVPSEPDTTVALALYREDDATKPVGSARAVQIGPHKCEIALDFDSPESARYVAEITSLPAAPMPVAFSGDDESRAAVQDALPRLGVAVSLVGTGGAAPYTLAVKGDRLALMPAGRDLEIGFVSLAGRTLADAAASLSPAVKHVMQWERSLALQNHRTAMDTSKVDLVYVEQLDGGEHSYAGPEAVLDYTRTGDEWRAIRGRMKVRNRTAQTLHGVLVYFSEAYGVHILGNNEITPGDNWVTVWGDGPSDNFYLDDGVDESLERFKLIVSTERVDDFLLVQDELTLGDQYGDSKAIASVQPPRKALHRNEWFAKDFRIHVVRRLDVVGMADRTVGNGQIVVKGHPAVTANISLRSASTAARGVGASAGFYYALEQRGLTLVNFASARGDDVSVLDLADIQNASSLSSHPLEILLKWPLGDDEGILPLVYDGEHVLLGGAPQKELDGTTRILIDSIPAAVDGRRSLGGSLKLYFFKTVLKHERVNQLRWIDFKDDGSTAHRTNDLAGKVAGARRVLLLVHGITGDTDGMAAGARACALNEQFDLVLAYDYENLATPIADTARLLKAQLAAAGLNESDDRHLTMLVHSMGGLVSRWFIEREGGNRIVDHLVMCGTPNHGSPFGRIEDARKVLSMLTVLAINYLPAAVPFSSGVLFLLNRTKSLTPTLEQMHPASEFIRTLNESGDPGVRYTILAGDVDTYDEASDAWFPRLLAKAGKSAAFDTLFARQANDIAVGVESILGIAAERRYPPSRSNVACHHLNYFVSEPGQRALKSVAW